MGVPREPNGNDGAREAPSMSSGERDLDTILATMDVARRPGAFAYLQVVAGTTPPPGAAAMIDEGATTTYVVAADSPAAAGATFRAAWLTITVHTALDGVGLTAALATALAAVGIPANVLAGLTHDHLLVPEERAGAAVAALLALTGR